MVNVQTQTWRRVLSETLIRLTSTFKELEPIPQYKTTAKLAGFLQSVRPL